MLRRKHVLGVLHAHGAGIHHQAPGRQHPGPHGRLGAAPDPGGVREGPLHQGHDRRVPVRPAAQGGHHAGGPHAGRRRHPRHRAGRGFPGCPGGDLQPDHGFRQPGPERDGGGDPVHRQRGGLLHPGGPGRRPGGDPGPRAVLRPAPGDRPGDPHHPDPPADPGPAGAAGEAQAGPRRAPSRAGPDPPGSGAAGRRPGAATGPPERAGAAAVLPARARRRPRWTPATWTCSWTSNCR